MVWYDSLSPNGTEYFSSFVAYEGKIIVAQCGGITVRPVGGNSTYPPTHGLDSPDGFHINFDLNELGVLEVDIKNNLVTLQDSVYYRWVGIIQGRIGNSTWHGLALYEQFNFSP